ncbi:unnamed protein product [Effrenium voratum]|nr:unnamed protein product [Effrenium voratum]
MLAPDLQFMVHSPGYPRARVSQGEGFVHRGSRLTQLERHGPVLRGMRRGAEPPEWRLRDFAFAAYSGPNAPGLRQVHFGRRSVWGFASAREHTEEIVVFRKGSDARRKRPESLPRLPSLESSGRFPGAPSAKSGVRESGLAARNHAKASETAAANAMTLAPLALSLLGAASAVLPSCDLKKPTAEVCEEYCTSKCSFYNRSAGDTGQPSTLKLYRLTPPNVTGLRNKNTGDPRGDMGYWLSKKNMSVVCAQDPLAHGCVDYANNLYGIFTVEVDGQFGPYLQCNPVQGGGSHPEFDPLWKDSSNFSCGQSCVVATTKGCYNYGMPDKNGTSGWGDFHCFCDGSQRDGRSVGRAQPPFLAPSTKAFVAPQCGGAAAKLRAGNETMGCREVKNVLKTPAAQAWLRVLGTTDNIAPQRFDWIPSIDGSVVTGEDVMSPPDFAAWWERTLEHGTGDGECFLDVLRVALARRLNLRNFHRLSVVCNEQQLDRRSPWMDSELLVVVRPYKDTRGEEAEEAAAASGERGEGLLAAASSGDLTRLVSLLEMPLDPDCVNENAARGGHLEIVQCLTAARADTNKRDHAACAPLHFAVGHLEVARCLLEAGAERDPGDLAGCTPLYFAAGQGRTEVVRCLLEAKADKDFANFGGRSPLINAAQARFPGKAAPHRPEEFRDSDLSFRTEVPGECSSGKLGPWTRRAGWFGVGDLGGLWYSTPSAGECAKQQALGTKGCTWKEVTSVYKNATCIDSAVDRLVELYGKRCFGTCGLPLNRTSDCYLDCYRDVLMGSAASNLTKIPSQRLVLAWEKAAETCPKVTPQLCRGTQCDPLEDIPELDALVVWDADALKEPKAGTDMFFMMKMRQVSPDTPLSKQFNGEWGFWESFFVPMLDEQQTMQALSLMDPGMCEDHFTAQRLPVTCADRGQVLTIPEDLVVRHTLKVVCKEMEQWSDLVNKIGEDMIMQDTCIIDYKHLKPGDECIEAYHEMTGVEEHARLIKRDFEQLKLPVILTFECDLRPATEWRPDMISLQHKYDAFGTVYHSNLLGGFSSLSGARADPWHPMARLAVNALNKAPGCHSNLTAGRAGRACNSQLLARFPDIRTVLDLGCGDMSWMQCEPQPKPEVQTPNRLRHGLALLTCSSFFGADFAAAGARSMSDMWQCAPSRRQWGVLLATVGTASVSPDSLLIRLANLEQPSRGCVLFYICLFQSVATTLGLVLVYRGPAKLLEACLATGWHFWAAACFLGLRRRCLLAGKRNLGLGLERHGWQRVQAPVCLTIAPRYIMSSEVAMIMLLEVLLGPLLAWLALGEAPPDVTLAAGVVLFVVLLLHEGYSARLARKLPAESKVESCSESTEAESVV